MNPSTFHIYNASAGSGKTFALTKSYLKILLLSKNLDTFKSILAITFTNKAVGEMKDRVIDSLKTFSNESILESSDTMFKLISEETELAPEVIHKRSKLLLNYLLHNYGGFEISTIDSFIHRIIRTFARDLKLPTNFEVELDQDRLLSEAVDDLISKAGLDKEITNILVDFAIEKSDNDKSYDISFDLNKIAKLLVNENDLPYLSLFKLKTLQDFNALSKNLSEQIKTIKEALDSLAVAFFKTLESNHIDANDFKGRYHLPQYFEKIKNQEYGINFNTAWQKDVIDGLPLYSKSLNEAKKEAIDLVQERLSTYFTTSKKLILNLHLLDGLYKNVVPLSVLKGIQESLDAIKTDQSKLLISEFNSLINDEIKNQPTPFIYERLGEKFNHHFIDEFQDTSKMQWTNLIPLINDTLSSEDGSATIVGDAKQAIYRWRGGESEQFIDLVTKNGNIFSIDSQVYKLESNFRSTKTIVEFNNTFFEFLGNEVFKNPIQAGLYKEATQKTITDKEGFISLNFLDLQDQDKDLVYPTEALNLVNDCMSRGYAYADICILVRKRKEGVLIGQLLGVNNIPISSSETLLLQNSGKIQFLVAFLKHLLLPEDMSIKFELLYHLSELNNIDDKNGFIQKYLHEPIETLIEHICKTSETLALQVILQQPIYELVEYVVRLFNLAAESDAYVQFFLDIIFEQGQKGINDLSSLIEYYDENSDKLSIVAPDAQEAVKIMTIHKSKGLEFPVVIFPYADLNIFDDRNSHVWFPVEEEHFNGFEALLLNVSSKMEGMNPLASSLYEAHQSELVLDHINLLYVTLTRAEKELHILSKVDVLKDGSANMKTYSGLFMAYLQEKGLWQSSKSKYTFGNSGLQQVATPSEATVPELDFISVQREKHHLKVLANSKYLWDTKQGEAIERGNLIHSIMSKIKTVEDVEFALTESMTEGLINSEESKELKPQILNIVTHPSLQQFYTSEFHIYNEQDIISPDGSILRPDRLCIDKHKQAYIIDYKSGIVSQEHMNQLRSYSEVLNEMGLKTKRKLLIYINQDIDVIVE